MVEYLYNCIRATAGQDVSLSAMIEDSSGAPITEHCHIMLLDKDKQLLSTIEGNHLDGGLWTFTIPAIDTKGKVGRYWYKICTREQSLCFTQPIYFIV